MKTACCILAWLALCGCYNVKKAQEQFVRAAVAYPEIPAQYCGNNFPVKDSLIKGDTVIVMDTIYTGGDLVTDTLIERDTVTITHIRTLPQKVITKVVRLTDTLWRENTAKVRSCELERSSLIDLLQKKTAEVDGWKSKAQKRGWIMWGLLLLIALVVGFNAYRIAKVKHG